jgi:hypothetical protein
VPVAEYRPNSQAIIYRVDPATMKAVEVFRSDHIGGRPQHGWQVAHGVSWGRAAVQVALGADGRITNAHAKPEALRVMNPAQYRLPGRHYVAGERMLCSGPNNM